MGGSGEGGSVFSQKTDIFPLLFDIVGQVKLSLTRFSVLLYDMPKPNIYRILYKKKIIRSSTPWIQSIMILAQGLLQVFCSAQIVFEIPC